MVLCADLQRVYKYKWCEVLQRGVEKSPGCIIIPSRLSFEIPLLNKEISAWITCRLFYFLSLKSCSVGDAELQCTTFHS